jgi:hypothetical protein
VLSAGQAAWPAAPAAPPAQNLGGEVILLVQNPPGGATPASACPAPPSSGAWSGHALPGGFGLLETLPGQPCEIKEYAYHWMSTDPGSSTGCDIEQFVGKVVNIPIFDCTASGLPTSEPPVGTCTAGSGSHAHYHRAGYAAFYLSGYNLTTTGSVLNKKKSVNPNFNAFPCSGPNRCISGWFLNGSLSATAIAGPPSGPGYFGTFTAVPAG